MSLNSKNYKKNINCVQCGEKMKNSYGNQYFAAPFCENAACPDYGLLQMGVILKHE